MQSVVVKARYENGQRGEDPEIRRFPGGATPTFTHVQDKVKHVFPGLETGLFNIFWKDSDGDLVLCSSEDEMKEALTSVRDNVLKLYISDSPASGDNMDGAEENPGCEGWRRRWGRRTGVCGGKGMRKGWRWRCAGGMPMEGVPPHVFRRWVKRSMKHCHRKGHCGSRTEGEVTPCEEFDNQPGYKHQRETAGGEHAVKENDVDANETEMNMDDIGRRHPHCHKRCPEGAEDTSSDDDRQPEVQFPSFPGMFPIGLPGFWGMMGPGGHPSHPPHPIGLGHNWWPRGGFHGFEPSHGGWHHGRDQTHCHSAERGEFGHGGRGRFRCHHHGKHQGECPRKRRQFQKETEKENATDGGRPGKDIARTEDDVIVMEG